jgi:hypothetical protein
MTDMKSAPCCKRYASQSFIPAILAMAYHWLVGSSGPVSYSVIGCGANLGKMHDEPRNKFFCAPVSYVLRITLSAIARLSAIKFRIRAVGVYATDLAGRKENGVRLGFCHPPIDLFPRLKSKSRRFSVRISQPSEPRRRTIAESSRCVARHVYPLVGSRTARLKHSFRIPILGELL